MIGAPVIVAALWWPLLFFRDALTVHMLGIGTLALILGALVAAVMIHNE